MYRRTIVEEDKEVSESLGAATGPLVEAMYDIAEKESQRAVQPLLDRIEELERRIAEMERRDADR